MSTLPDGLSVYGGALAGASLPTVCSAGGKWYYCDPTYGASGNSGERIDDACSNLSTLYDKLRDGYNDGIFFIGGSTAYNPSAAMTWSKSYAHLIGIGPALPGEGARSRIEGTATDDLTTIMTISGSGCVFENIKFSNLGDANTCLNCVIVTGGRNVFTNCMFAGMGHATPGAVATGNSLKLDAAEENLFYRCTIGRDTILRAAANCELWATGGAVRNKFVQCEFVSQSATAGKFMVIVDNIDRYLQFEDCLFYNFSTNWGTGPTDCFNVSASATHYIILRGACQLVGITGWGDTTTHIYQSRPSAGTSGGVNSTPAA